MMEKNDPIRKQLELNSLIEFSQLISSRLDLKYILDNILLSTMGKLLISKGVVLIKSYDLKEKNTFYAEAAKGLDSSLIGRSFQPEFPKMPVFRLSDIETPSEILKESGLQHFFKIYFQNKLLGVLCLGRKLNNTELSDAETISIETMLNISSSAIENTIRYNEVKNLNADLNEKVRQLRSLFELGKEFNSNIIDRDRIVKVLGFTLLGNFGVRDFIIYTRNQEGKLILVTDISRISSDIGSPDEYFPKGSTEKEFKSTLRVKEHKHLPFFDSLHANGFQLVIPALRNQEVDNLICLGGKLNKMEYTASDIEFLESIVNLSLISVQNSILFREFMEKQVLENELKIARDIQVALLPGKIPDVKGFDFAGMNLPAKQVGGDYFDIVKLTDNKAAVAIADVSGKGTPASLLMANIQSAVHSYLKIYDEKTFDLASVTGKINEMIYENTLPEKFITFFWGIIDCKENKFQYINAGHNPPYLFRNGTVTKLDKGGFMIGIIDTGVSYEVGNIDFLPGDTLVLYTDGVTEAQDTRGEEFGDERLISICEGVLSRNSEEIMNAITEELFRFTEGTIQYDDITMIVARKLNHT